MISAVVFDWGGVLIENPEQRLQSYCALYFHVSEKQFRSAYAPFASDFQRGLLKEEVLWARVCARLKVAPHMISSLWKTAFESAYVENRDVFSLASSLKKKGYTIGFLSNTEIPGMKIFFDHHYDQFDVTVFSCVEKILKPDKRVYQILLDRLCKHPDEVVFIDDRQVNIDGARAIGMHAILFTTYDRLLRDLSALSLCIDDVV